MIEVVKQIGIVATAVGAVLGLFKYRELFNTMWRRLRPARRYPVQTVSPFTKQSPVVDPAVREHLPPGADPRAWPWRAAGPSRVRRPTSG